MTAPATLRQDDLRCSSWARQMEVDPIGSAGCYAGYLLLEWPLPWPEDLAEIPELASLLPVLRQENVRLQGLVAPATSDERHAIFYRRPAGGHGATFERRELRAPLEQLIAAAGELLAGGGDDVTGRDLLVCTHGRRDRCCGSFGMALFQELVEGPELPGVAVWRTSHTGGHRFAPTAVVLPEATAWAFLDAPTLRQIIGRRGELDAVLERYRGYAGLSFPQGQALERAVLVGLGWAGLDAARADSRVGDDVFELSVGTGSGARRWRASVEIARQLPVPACGAPIEEARKTAPEWRVEDVVEIR